MSHADEDPRCPHCGEPIGLTATYCMHCSADLTAERERADTEGDGFWDRGPAGPDAGSSAATESATGTATGSDGAPLAPDGLLDDSLTVLVGLVGGLVVGIVGTFVLLGVTESVWAFPVGVAAWLLATAHLVRRRTVQAAVARAAYGVAVVLLLVPLLAFSPGTDGSLDERVTEFGVLLLLVAVPALVAAGVGVVASRLSPTPGASDDRPDP